MATTSSVPPISPKPLTPIPEEPRSDPCDTSCAPDSNPVMAEQSAQDVVNQALSVGDLSPADAPATNNHNSATTGDEVEQLSEKQENFEDFTSYEHEIGGPVKSAGEDNDTIERRPTPSNTSYTNGSYLQADPSEENGSYRESHEASGGSDAETSRLDGMRSQQAESGNAVKKAGFKPVSFAKMKVSTPTPTAKTGESKASLASTSSSTTPLQSTSRPRLVAKTGSGLRDSAPKAFKSGGKNGAGPDPMQVWNKNRPAPAPSTKHLTDEELKQQYGIHMTSRIQADGEGKEAKWADIDDDEDDWAPETIEWNDGTKISLHQADALPTPLQELKPSSARLDPVASQAAKKILNPQMTTSIGPNAKVLKIGQNAEKQAKTAATQQKGSIDKPTLSNINASAPTPTKSPWASLPPVEKSPIAINPQPPISQQRGYFPPQPQQQPSAVVQSPAQEISADDFNRNWRDSQSSGPRELFMPSSGRYEAVGDGKRRPSRNDQHFRQPSVLQRPNGNDSRSPAEPSAAFQTNRTSVDQDRGQWGRRRTSSNVSGGSGQFRRMSVNKMDSPQMPGDLAQQHQRRGSKVQHAAPYLYQAHGPARGASPGRISGDSRVPTHDSPRLSHVSSEAVASPIPHQVEPTAPVTPQEDPVTMQKRIMAEKRELARKRRLEEEEKEETAKRERIRAKMQALGLDPPAQKAETVLTPAPEITAFEKSQVEANNEVTAAPQSPPKPPVPEASGGPKQYGMMKVHHPDSVKRMIPQQQSQSSRPTEISSPHQQSTLAIHEARSDPLKPTQPVVNGIGPSSDDIEVRRFDRSQENMPSDKTNQGWNDSTHNSAVGSPWSGTRTEPQSQKNSLWSLNSNKALGNGTFDRSLAGFSSPRGQLPPPDQTNPSTLWAHDRPAFPAVEMSPQLQSIPQMSHAESAQTMPAFPSPEQRPLAANSEVDSAQPISRPMPIGPPHPQTIANARQITPNVRTPQVAAWNNFHNVAAREDRVAHEKYRQELAARMEEEARAGTRQSPQITYNETWRQVEAGEQAGQRQVVGVRRTTNAPGQAVNGFGSLGSKSADTATKAPNGLGGGQRASRFFPQGANGIVPQGARAVTYSHPEISRSPSPPPPEESSHPAFSGDMQRPHVNLPKAKPVVKLPPKGPPSPAIQQPVLPSPSWSAVVTQRSVSTPVSKADVPPANWQSRFNSLLNKKDALVDTKDNPIVSSTKEMLDVHAEESRSFAVSLPPTSEVIPEDSGLVTSKNVEDENDIFEDRVAGSLPVIKIPSEVPLAILRPFRPQHNHRKPHFVKQVNPTTIQTFTVDMIESSTAGRDSIVIHIPGAIVTKKPYSPRVDQGGAVAKLPRNGQGFKNRRGLKSRESSGNFKQPQQQKSGQQNGSVPSPRSGYQQQSSGWRGPRPAAAGVAH